MLDVAVFPVVLRRFHITLTDGAVIEFYLILLCKINNVKKMYKYEIELITSGHYT